MVEQWIHLGVRAQPRDERQHRAAGRGVSRQDGHQLVVGQAQGPGVLHRVPGHPHASPVAAEGAHHPGVRTGQAGAAATAEGVDGADVALGVVTVVLLGGVPVPQILGQLVAFADLPHGVQDLAQELRRGGGASYLEGPKGQVVAAEPVSRTADQAPGDAAAAAVLAPQGLVVGLDRPVEQLRGEGRLGGLGVPSPGSFRRQEHEHGSNPRDARRQEVVRAHALEAALPGGQVVHHGLDAVQRLLELIPGPLELQQQRPRQLLHAAVKSRPVPTRRVH